MRAKASGTAGSVAAQSNGSAGRDGILDAAAKLFSEKGFEATSINDLARAVGLSKATVYHYFSDKNEIYIDVILRTLSALCEHVEKEIAGEKTAAAKFRRYAEAHAEYFEANLEAYTAATVGFGGLRQPLQRRQAVTLRDRHEGNLRRILEEGVRVGEFRDIDVRLATRSLLSCLNWMVRWYRRGGGKTAVEIACEYADMLLTGIVAPARRGQR